MPGPGSGEYARKMLDEKSRAAGAHGGTVMCDVCGVRPAVTWLPRTLPLTGQMEYEPWVCQQCADELREMEAGA